MDVTWIRLKTQNIRAQSYRYFNESRSPSGHKPRGLHLAGALMEHFLEGSAPNALVS